MLALETHGVEDCVQSLTIATKDEDNEALLAACLPDREPYHARRAAAAGLLARFGSLSGVLTATSEALAAAPGQLTWRLPEQPRA